MSTPEPQNQPRVTPLGLAVAILIICLLATLAIPRLQAVSADRNRPESPRILSAFDSSGLPAVMSGVGTGGGVSAASATP
jgi:hypothetical protein